MPRRQDIQKILILGSGPIVIGQACEFDYSGTQACKVLMKEGFEVVLVNSNPATIMTDPELASKVYIEPLQAPFIERIIEKEKPQALIPTLGGQTALNLALELESMGVLSKHGVVLLGANPKVIRAAEDREEFRGILESVGARYPKSELVRSYEQGIRLGEVLGYPLILRPNYTLGGGGGGIAYNRQEYEDMLAQALRESPTSEVLVEESILGWKEFELEIMRDKAGSFVVVCTIENFDPCGVHTGDSITVAPQQTLSDREYQAMRDEACKIVQAVGVETGGANIQFAVHPGTGERVVIEMNPRVSRSSALASKATGFPIAKIAALLAVGYTMDEITNDITKSTPTCYEPALDYIVTKIPRFAFEKFPGSKDLLSTQMRSVGEVMGIGRTLTESLMKALASLEFSAEAIPNVVFDLEKITHPNSQRIWHLFEAFRSGYSIEQINAWTQIDFYFLEALEEIVSFEKTWKDAPELTGELLLRAKKLGFTDSRLAALRGLAGSEGRGAITELRRSKSMHPAFFPVDTCAGEFRSSTPYFYSTYWSRPDPSLNLGKSGVAVIGAGPNRIGQGIEFDYGCVRGVKALQRFGKKVVMINSNPETVSTDYDTADYLFFEPLTVEHVSEVLRYAGVDEFVTQFGGQTPIAMAEALSQEGRKILGSSLNTLDLTEDRSLFSRVCADLGLKVPASGLAKSFDDAKKIALKIAYPVMVRPSYVLGGRRMEVLENPSELEKYFSLYGDLISEKSPLYMDQFLEGALEVDVDLVRGVDWAVIGGIVEHIEAAGVHSGDSMGVLPPERLKPEVEKDIERLSLALAERLQVLGHLNLQLAVKQDQIYVLEANPRSSRSVPFVAKATGIPLVDLAVAGMLGWKSERVKPEAYRWNMGHSSHVKGVVFPFKKFQNSDVILGPEMKSTGETMGRGQTYAEALMKAFLASHVKLPQQGEVFLSLRDKDKNTLFALARELARMGFTLSATSGTADYFNEMGLKTVSLRKVHEGRPNCVDHIRSGRVALVINTTHGKTAIQASYDIRRACIDLGVPCITESDTAWAFLLALKQARMNTWEVSPLSLGQNLSFSAEEKTFSKVEADAPLED